MNIVFGFAYILLFLPFFVVVYLFLKSRSILNNRGRVGIVPVICVYMLLLLILYISSFVYQLFGIFFSQLVPGVDFSEFARISLLVERFLLYPLGLGTTLYFIYGIISSQEVTTND